MVATAVGVASPGVSVAGWVALVVAAALVGFAKTAVAGTASISIALFALVLPARESTGALLVLLLAGDAVALAVFRRHCSVPTLLRMVPGVLPGLVLGWWFVGHAGNAVLQPTIGAILLCLTVVALWQRRRATTGEASAAATSRAVGTWTPALTGLAAGFATMTANAGGPVMTLYLVSAGLSVVEMVGTAAWFFASVNLAKLPFSAALGLVGPATVRTDLVLLPALLLGAGLGLLVSRTIRRQRFEWLALLAGAVAAAALLYPT